jgi:hypothetical protein
LEQTNQGSQSHSIEPPGRWMRWTPARKVVAGAWIALTTLFGLLLAYGAALFSLGFPSPSDFSLRHAALRALEAGLSLAAGPFGVWVFRRRPLWLILAAAALVVGGIVGVSLVLASANAPGLFEP